MRSLSIKMTAMPLPRFDISIVSRNLGNGTLGLVIVYLMFRMYLSHTSEDTFYFTICLYISSIPIVPPLPVFSLQPVGPLLIPRPG